VRLSYNTSTDYDEYRSRSVSLGAVRVAAIGAIKSTVTLVNPSGECVRRRLESETGTSAAERSLLAARLEPWHGRTLRVCAACLELARAASYRPKPLRSSRGCMFAKCSNHADGL
jgi:hypothetical protein